MPIRRAIAPIYDGLLAYWPLNVNLGRDVTGNGFDGTLNTITGADLKDDRVRQALNFNGSTYYINTTGPALSGLEFTISAWVKVASICGDEVYFSLGNSATDNNTIHLQLQAAPALHFGMWNDDLNATISTIDGLWTMLTVTLGVEAGTVTQRAYQDGFQIGSRATTGNSFFTGNTVCEIGRWTTFGGIQYFSGLIAELQIYNRPLSAGEVMNLYTSSDPGWMLTGFAPVVAPAAGSAFVPVGNFPSWSMQPTLAQ